MRARCTSSPCSTPAVFFKEIIVDLLAQALAEWKVVEISRLTRNLEGSECRLFRAHRVSSNMCSCGKFCQRESMEFSAPIFLRDWLSTWRSVTLHADRPERE